MSAGDFTYRTETPVQLTPHKCPKCNGSGWLGCDPAYPAFNPITTSAQSSWRCDVCDRGILWSRIAEATQTTVGTKP